MTESPGEYHHTQTAALSRCYSDRYWTVIANNRGGILECAYETYLTLLKYTVPQLSTQGIEVYFYSLLQVQVEAEGYDSHES